MIADDLLKISNYFEVNVPKSSCMKLHQSVSKIEFFNYIL